MPRCYKWNDVLGCIAADCVTFVDDLRTIGATLKLVQLAMHRVETMMSYLGLQDATRKRRPIIRRRVSGLDPSQLRSRILLCL